MGDKFENIKDSTIVNKSTTTGSIGKNDPLHGIRLPSEKEVWFKRPIGLVILGVIIAVIARFIFIKLGWFTVPSIKN